VQCGVFSQQGHILRNREWKGGRGGGRGGGWMTDILWPFQKLQSYEYEYKDYKVNLKWKGRATKTLSGTELCRPLRLPVG
jgi:hypothetical protein